MKPTPTFLTGDCRDVLKRFPDNHFDACVTDPPYGLSPDGRARNWDQIEEGRKRGGFMGAEWDTAVPGPSLWAELARTLKPGAHALIFGSTRTFYRLGVAIEDGGLQIRESYLWIHGQGFPKSLDAAKALDQHLDIEREVVGTQMIDVGMQGGQMHSDRPRKIEERPVTTATSAEAKHWAGWRTATKPAGEPIILARKPISEPTIAENLLKWGVGALNIDATRIRYRSTSDFESLNENRKAHRTVRQGTIADGYGMKPEGIALTEQSPIGRFTANVILQHGDACRPLGPKRVRGNGHWSGKPPEGGGLYRLGLKEMPDRGNLAADGNGLEEAEDWDCEFNCPVRILDEQAGDRIAGGQPFRRGPDGIRTAYGSFKGQAHTGPGVGPSEGGASRFFFCAKAQPAERAFFCRVCGAAFMMEREEDHVHNGAGRGHLVYHFTVKPQDTVRWLALLITPEGGRIIDPFVGSGTTCVVAQELGFESVGIDLSSEHIAMSRVRCGIDVTGPLDRFVKAGAKS